MRTIIMACIEVEQHAFEKGLSIFLTPFKNMGEDFILDKEQLFFPQKLSFLATKYKL